MVSRRVAPLVVLGLGVAGCLSSPLEDLFDGLETSAGSLAFAPPVLLPLDQGSLREGFEPSITVDGAGNVVATAARGIRVGRAPDTSWLWVSHDGGAGFRSVAWTEGRPLSNLPAGFEGHVDAARDGSLYYVDMTLASISVSRSTDGGATWQLRSGISALLPVVDRPWVAGGPAGRVYLVWNQIPSGAWVAASADGGTTFPVQTLLPGTSYVGDALGGPGAAWAAVPAVAPDGTLFVARGEPTGPAVYVSRDGARTFARHLAWPAEGRVGWMFTTVAVDEAGTAYVSTVEEFAAGTRVRFAYSKDAGETWSAPREVVDAAGTHALQWGAAGAPGHFAVAFYEQAGSSAVPDAAQGDWHVRVAVSRNADTTEPRFVTGLATDASIHRGTICTRGQSPDCDGNDRALGDYLGVDIGPDGAVHVAFADDTTGDQRIWARRTVP